MIFTFQFVLSHFRAVILSLIMKKAKHNRQEKNNEQFNREKENVMLFAYRLLLHVSNKLSISATRVFF